MVSEVLLARAEPVRIPVEPIRPPQSLEATGLSDAVVFDLVLKHLRRHGDCSTAELAMLIALPVPVLDRLLGFLRTERLVEIPGRGNFDADVRFSLTDLGRARAEDAFQRNRYIGAAPVSLADYVAQVGRQRISGARIAPDRLAQVLQPLVLPPELIATLGAAVNSQRPMFLYGPSGAGKTWLAEHLVDVIEGAIWVPHAIEVDGEIIQVFDPIVHRPIGASHAGGSFDRSRQPDGRWVLCERPVVKLGGEMTLSMMDLELDPVTRFYKAPAQLKANNGALVFDDLGRQRSSASQILNRWIVPLDRRVDYLSLHTGTSFEVPFDALVFFSSNLSPASLDDPAFVRRLGYKIRLDALDEAAYRCVFRQACERADVEHDESAADFLIDELHRRSGMPLLAAYPLDLVLKIRDRAVYEGSVARLTPEALSWAWALYFAAESGADDD
ncbi:MAG: ATPase [Burkholderiales bacterium]|jgi:predicted ATPase with chaperone activity|nr:MAG: ATPase [Burkholderiales bacterium]